MKAKLSLPRSSLHCLSILDFKFLEVSTFSGWPMYSNILKICRYLTKHDIPTIDSSFIIIYELKSDSNALTSWPYL